jgi:hypothetical protein
MCIPVQPARIRAATGQLQKRHFVDSLLQHVRSLFVLIQDDVYALEFSMFNKISHCHRLHHSYPLPLPKSARSLPHSYIVSQSVHLPNPAIYSTTPKLRSVASSGLDAWALHVGLRRGQSCSTDPRQVFATRQRNAKGSTIHLWGRGLRWKDESCVRSLFRSSGGTEAEMYVRSECSGFLHQVEVLDTVTSFGVETTF